MAKPDVLGCDDTDVAAEYQSSRTKSPLERRQVAINRHFPPAPRLKRGSVTANEHSSRMALQSLIRSRISRRAAELPGLGCEQLEQ